MEQVLIASFCSAFGLADTNPVGCLVAGALKSALLDKGLQEIQRMMIDSHPVVGDPPGTEGQYLTGQMFNRDPWQDEEPGVVRHEVKMLFFCLFIPADEGIAGLY